MTSSDILSKLFGSASRIKLIRLFLLNPEEIIPFNAAIRRTKVSKQAGRRELVLLKNIGLIKPRTIAFGELRSRPKPHFAKATRGKKKKIQGWKLNDSFPLFLSLKSFILDTSPISKDFLLKKLQKTGRLKLVILAGIFGKENSSRVDIFIVGDAVKKSSLERIIRSIEAEVGKELTYAVFSTQDFLYRLGMYDKFIRDILDYPHEKILDKIGV